MIDNFNIPFINLTIISAWEDEKFSQETLDFSNKLRANVIDASMDQYKENPNIRCLFKLL